MSVWLDILVYMILYAVPDRTAEMLLSTIKYCIEPGTTTYRIKYVEILVV